MANLYDKYLELKKGDSTKFYLFKSGIFFVFLDDDAKYIANELGLKLTDFRAPVVKCGFPVKELNKYTKFLKLLNINYDLIYLGDEKVLNEIRNIFIDDIEPNEALSMIKKWHCALGTIDTYGK